MRGEGERIIYVGVSEYMGGQHYLRGVRRGLCGVRGRIVWGEKVCKDAFWRERVYQSGSRS